MELDYVRVIQVGDGRLIAYRLTYKIDESVGHERRLTNYTSPVDKIWARKINLGWVESHRSHIS